MCAPVSFLVVCLSLQRETMGGETHLKYLVFTSSLMNRLSWPRILHLHPYVNMCLCVNSRGMKIYHTVFVVLVDDPCVD